MSLLLSWAMVKQDTPLTGERLMRDSDFLMLAYLFSGIYSTFHVPSYITVFMTSQQPWFWFWMPWFFLLVKNGNIEAKTVNIFPSPKRTLLGLHSVLHEPGNLTLSLNLNILPPELYVPTISETNFLQIKVLFKPHTFSYDILSPCATLAPYSFFSLYQILPIKT